MWASRISGPPTFRAKFGIFSKVECNDYTGNITVFHLKQGDNDHNSGFQYPQSAHPV